MFLIPNSWQWRELKLALTVILCSLPIILIVLLKSFYVIIIVILWSIIIIKNAYYKPFHLNILYARFFFEYLFERPDLLTQLRPLGLDLFNTHLHPYSITFQNRYKNKIRKEFAYLRSFKYDQQTQMSADQKRSYDVMEYFIRESLTNELSDEFQFHMYLINQCMGTQSEIISFLIKYHRIQTTNDAQAYLLRVQRISNAFDQLIEQQLERRNRGIETPRFVLKRVLTELNAFHEQLKNETNQSPLVTSFVDKLNKLNETNISKNKQNDFIRRLIAIIHVHVSPAYDRLINILEDDLSKTESDHGVWKLPNGDKYYQLCLAAHTTTDMSPDEIHQLGLKHVERIQTEMRRILKENQVETWQDFRGSLNNYEHNIEEKYENVETSRQTILDDYRRIIDDIDSQMDGYFSAACRPTNKCVVERVPQFKEATSPGAYYFPAALDGSSPGTFFANLRNVDEVCKFKMRTLAYHEAVPGHHFQISIAQSLKHLPFFRRMIPFTAYMEGWALYTEQLAAEKGFHAYWLSYLGYLDAQLMRSCRLVVDTGIHWKRWSREKAIDYMTENTCMKKDEVITEIERYFVMPGQACAYMVGCQTILSLREKAQLALGNKFDLKQFHDAVLLHGALPLKILESVIDEYIRDKIRSI